MRSAERDRLFKYWAQFSGDPSIETMMLNPHAHTVDESDKLDVLEGLPPNTASMSVLEIGAGIGRFTEPLAQRCKQVHATDFIQSFVDRNRELHSVKYPNVTYAVGDCVHMSQPPSSRDLVFTNWLLMYLTNEEAVDFVQNCIQWLRPGGYLNLRESCTESSTRTKSTQKKDNPTYYRHVSQYIHLLRSVRWQDPDTGLWWTFKPLWSRSIRTYIAVKKNWRQCQMLVRKVAVTELTPHLQNSTTASLFRVLDESFEMQARVDAEVREIHAMRVKDEEKLGMLRKELEMLAQGTDPSQITVLNLDPSSIDCFALAETYDCKVIGKSSDPYKFAGWLDMAVKISDIRVSFVWSEFELESWILPNSANLICGLESLADYPNYYTVLECLKKSLKPNGKLLFMSPISTQFFEELQTQFSVLTISCPKEELVSEEMPPETPSDSASEEEGEGEVKTSKKVKHEHAVV